MRSINPNRGVVTEIVLSVTYPDGTAGANTIQNADDTLVSLIFDEDFAARLAAAGLLDPQVVADWRAPAGWHERHTAILRQRPARVRDHTLEDCRNCLICNCGMCQGKGAAPAAAPAGPGPNPQRGVVTGLALAITYPDGSTARPTIENRDDSLVALVFDEKEAERIAAAGLIDAQVVSPWLAETQWQKRDTFLSITRSKAPGAYFACMVCKCRYCEHGPIPWPKPPA